MGSSVEVQKTLDIVHQTGRLTLLVSSDSGVSDIRCGFLTREEKEGRTVLRSAETGSALEENHLVRAMVDTNDLRGVSLDTNGLVEAQAYLVIPVQDEPHGGITAHIQGPNPEDSDVQKVAIYHTPAAISLWYYESLAPTPVWLKGIHYESPREMSRHISTWYDFSW